MIGQSFMPSALDEEQRRKRKGAGTVQEAIKTLSFNVPRFRGGGGIADVSLLAGPGGANVAQGASYRNPIVESILAAIAGGQLRPGGGIPGGPPIPQGPPPKPDVQFQTTDTGQHRDYLDDGATPGASSRLRNPFARRQKF